MDPRLTRFLALGLRSNPFANAVFDPREPGAGSALAHRLLTAGGPITQVLGEKGAGKTHAVEWVRARWQRSGRRVGYVHLELPGEAFGQPGPALDSFVLDEACRATSEALAELGRWARGAPGRRVLVTAHRDVRAGLLDPAAESLAAGSIDRSELEGYVAARLARTRFAGLASPVGFGDDAWGALVAGARGNWQRLVDLLYRIFEELGPDGAVTRDRVAAAAAHLDARGV